MKTTQAPISLFVCTPITRKMENEAGIARLRRVVNAIDEAARSRGAFTVCAFREEGWRGEERPEVFVPRDIQWARECDGAVLVPGGSYGVRIEEGWLSAFGKPMLRLYGRAVRHVSDLEKNLGHIVPVFDRAFASLREARDAVVGFVAFLEGRAVEMRGSGPEAQNVL